MSPRDHDGKTSMILRMAGTALLLTIAASVASAQREPRRPFPAEKFSSRPVQPNQNSKPAAMPLGSDKEQKDRWEDRSRDPSRMK
jgi:hypothetical protein